MSLGTRIKNAVHEFHVEIKIIWEKSESFSYKADIKFTSKALEDQEREISLFI
jgi:hypothetical protein